MEKDKEKYETVNLVRVRFRTGEPPFCFHTPDLKIQRGDWVMVPFENSQEVGEVLTNPVPISLPDRCLPPPVAGIASPDEKERHFSHLQLEKEAWETCNSLIESLGLAMKLIRVRFLFDESKLIIFYYSKSRVDFRELVKELVKAFKVRIEMRQIGIRHTTKMIGGIGNCGKELCCATFLKDFDPVSIKMAKVQNLPLNPNKISGRCGRLLCCLSYEYENYLTGEEESQEALPDWEEDEMDLEKELSPHLPT